MKKVTILTLHLNYGLIEKMAVSLSNLLSNDYEVKIVSAYEISNKCVYDISKKEKIIYLKKDLKPNKKELKECLNNRQIFKFIKEFIKFIKILKFKKKLMIDFLKKDDSDVIISTRPIFNEWVIKFGNKSAKKIFWNHEYLIDEEKIKKFVKKIRGFDYIINPTEEQNKMFMKYFNNSIYIPDFLNFVPGGLSLLSDNSIIFKGNLNDEKGVKKLIEISKILSKKYDNWLIHVIGGGKYYNYLADIIEKENLKINLYGFLDDEAIKRIYYSASIYISTSTNITFDLNLLEACSYGIPCLTYDRPPFKSFISDNWDGYIVKYDDKEKMCRRLSELIDNDNRRIIMGKNARKKIDKFDKNLLIIDWKKIIDE